MREISDAVNGKLKGVDPALAVGRSGAAARDAASTTPKSAAISEMPVRKRR